MYSFGLILVFDDGHTKRDWLVLTKNATAGYSEVRTTFSQLFSCSPDFENTGLAGG